MARAAEKTGIGPTVLVAIEQHYPEKQRIVFDDMACKLLTPGMKLFVKCAKPLAVRNWMIGAMEKEAPGLYCSMVCRKRCIDDLLLENANSVKQIVNLGAGFDTRAYRFSELRDIPFFEVDQPNNIKEKRTAINKALGEVPPNVKLVEMDFDRQQLNVVLSESGYSSKLPAFFIWEAVSQYLTAQGIDSTFEFLRGAAPGSTIAFTYVLRDFIEGRQMYGWEKGYGDYVKKGMWLFGMMPQEWPEFLKNYGWELAENFDIKQLRERYVLPSGRQLETTPLEQIAYARKV